MSNDDRSNEELICPVRGKFVACNPQELTPLREYLQSGQPVTSEMPFTRGTLLPDGRLDLCKQEIGAGGAALLADAVSGYSHVKHLLLGANGLGPAGAKTVANVISENPHLETIYLGCNLIDEQGTIALAEAVADHPSMTAFWIKRNPLGVQGAKAIVEMLERNPRLRTLDLVYTDLTSEGIRILCEALARAECSLSRLYLGGNKIGPAEAHLLGEVLHNNERLTELYLSVNRLGDEGAEILAEALRKNCTLEVLSLASNGLGPAGAWHLATALQTHPALRSLDFGWDRSTHVLGERANCIGDEGAAAMAELLQGSAPLQLLDLRENNITTDGALLLLDALETQRTLRELRLSKGISRKVKQSLEERLEHNRKATPAPELHPDVAAILSVYRTHRRETA